MVSKVPGFDIGKYQEAGEVGKHLDKSLLSGTVKTSTGKAQATTFAEDLSIVIDNLVHNLMAIYFQVETCVKSLKETGEFKWINKENLVKDLHDEIYEIFKSVANHQENYDNLEAIDKNIKEFEKVYDILQKAGVDEKTIIDIEVMLNKSKELLGRELPKAKAKARAKEAVKGDIKETKKQLEAGARGRKATFASRFEPEELQEQHPIKVRKEKYDAKANELGWGRQELKPTKFTREEAENLIYRQEELQRTSSAAKKQNKVEKRAAKFQGRVEAAKVKLEAEARGRKATFATRYEPEELQEGHPIKVKKEAEKAKKISATNKFNEDFPSLGQKETRDHEVTSKREKHVVENKKYKTDEDSPSEIKPTFEKDIARVTKNLEAAERANLKEKAKLRAQEKDELQKKAKEVLVKKEKYEARADRIRKESKSVVRGDVKATKKRLEAEAKEKKATSAHKIKPEELPEGHPTRVRKEKNDLKAQLRPLRKEIADLMSGAKSIIVDESKMTLAQRTGDKAGWIRRQKELFIEGKKQQLAELEKKVEEKTTYLRERDTEKTSKKRELKSEIKETRNKKDSLKKEISDLKNDKVKFDESKMTFAERTEGNKAAWHNKQRALALTAKEEELKEVRTSLASMEKKLKKARMTKDQKISHLETKIKDQKEKIKLLKENIQIANSEPKLSAKGAVTGENFTEYHRIQYFRDSLPEMKNELERLKVSLKKNKVKLEKYNS